MRAGGPARLHRPVRRHREVRTGTARRRSVLLTVLALCATGLVSAGVAPARAAQATGTEAAVWQTGWTWTYATTFRYSASNANATLNENVTLKVAGKTTFNGQPAYQLTMSGTVTGGSGSASGQNLTIKGGSVSGGRIVRVSDLALLQEHQVQHITGCAGPLCAVGVTADVDLTLTPTPTWHQHDFPLNAGDAWQLAQVIDYHGSFSYDAGSIGGSGSDNLDGSIPFAAPVKVSNQTINAAGGSVPTLLVDATKADSSAISRLWWSAAHKYDARDYLKLPLSDATLEIDRVLSSSSTPAPATTITENLSDSLTCAGGTVTVSGALSTAASGVGVNVSLDRSQIGAGVTTVSTTTGVNGTYSATLTVPSQSDGLAKNGSRANWGVTVSAPSAGADNVRTLVVTPKDCSTIAYTGPAGGAQFGSTTVSAKLTDLASAGGAAGRTVTFALSGGSSVSVTTNASGVATATLPIPGPPRSATITVSFAGAADLEGASADAAFTVGKATTSTTVSPSSPTVTIGDPVTFTATVAQDADVVSIPSGTVQFLVDGADFGAPVALTGSTATSPALASNVAGLGDHTVQAVYNGDANYATSSSPAVTFRVRNPLLPTTTTGTAAPGSAVRGQVVTLSADVARGSGTDAVTGSVTFKDGATVLGAAGLDSAGHAALEVSSLAVGSHSIAATYSGDDVYAASSSAPVTVSIARAATSGDLVAADDTTVSGEAVNLTATFGAVAPGAGVPTGTAQLLVDGTPIGDPVALVGGVATFEPLTSLGAGDHTLAAAYGGDGDFGPSTATTTQHVTKADTTTSLLASPSPSVEGHDVTLTATVIATAPGSGSPTGTVVFRADGNEIGAAPVSVTANGVQASLDVSTLAPGAHTLEASYSGDGDYRTSDSAPVSHTVVEAAAVVGTTTTLTSSANPSTYGELVSFQATVAAEDDSVPTGAVQFSVDGVDVGDPVPLDANGAASSPSIASPAPGDHTVIAAYLPPATYAVSGAILTQTVAAAGVDLGLESSQANADVGQPVHFTATVASREAGTGTPTGFVQFSVDGSPLGDAVPLDGGSATSPSVDDLAPGTHTVAALYSGDEHFLPVSTTISQHVRKMVTSTVLAVAPGATTYGDTVQLTATVTPAAGNLGAPTGTVTFRDGSAVLATVPLAADGGHATASISRSDLGAGTHVLVAEYAGTDSFAASASAPVTLTVAKKPTSLHADAVLLRLNPLLGINVGVLRATLTTSDGPLAGQPVVFTKGTATVCTATTDATGLATCTPSVTQWLTLALGGGFTATYPGTADYAGSTDHGELIQ